MKCRRKRVDKYPSEQEVYEALTHAAQSSHHPACPIATGKGQTTITHDDCTCHVRKAKAIIDWANTA